MACCNIYRHPKQNIPYFLSFLSKILDYFSIYDSIIINGDFNIELINTLLSEFLALYSLYNHMKSKTCWKSPLGSCIDLFLSNQKFLLMNTGTVETGLSDYHSLIYTMLKTKYDRYLRKSSKIEFVKLLIQTLLEMTLLIN